MGQLWYFGGIMGDNRSDRQVLKLLDFILYFIKSMHLKVYIIKGCKFIRQNDLAFDFVFGACNTFGSKSLLCFGTAEEGKTCHR